MRTKLKEKCAVYGVSLRNNNAAVTTFNGLLSLQHRGQEGAGIAVVDEGRIACHKGVGLVSEVFIGGELEKLPQGNIAVGHTRYGTTGSHTKENVGPFVTEYLTGRIATAHNGNITNAQEIRKLLKSRGVFFNATSDSEVASSLMAYCITAEQDTLTGVTQAVGLLRGAFSLVIASGDDKLIAVRDANGFRPLCIGENEDGIAIASESCALEVCGFKFIRDVRPGEIVEIEKGEIKSERVLLTQKEENRGLCIFEYIYFARPDSIIDGLSVYEAQLNMGAELMQENPVDADIVCGVPDSGLVAAKGYSMASGIPMVQGFVLNRYIGRSFIYPTQTERDSAVRLKLNPLSVNLKGKRVILVDDSMVRGTTTKKKVQSVRNAGATEVHLRIASPPFRHTCHYGTDIDSEENLVANKMSIDEIRQAVGVDSLAYLSVDRLKNACAKCNLSFCTACFTGNDTERVSKNIFE
jgi:amidophosphoribosyltransferase